MKNIFRIFPRSKKMWRYNFRKVFCSYLKYRPVWITSTIVHDNYPGQSYEAAHNLARTLARKGKVSWVEEA